MLAIENTTIVGGSISGDNLMLTPRVGSPINAGNVRGATGAPGINTVDYNNGQAVTAALIAAMMPVGVILDYPSTTAPANWLAMTGQTITNGQTLYPALWAILPGTMKAGSNIVLPDTRGRVTVGFDASDSLFSTIGQIGGVQTNTIAQTNLPAVSLTVDPPSTTVLINGLQPSTSATGIGGAPVNPRAQISVTESYQPGAQGTINVDIASFQTSNMGSGTPVTNMQPYSTFLKIIKVV
jgi:hypothetical protein